jgi:hypothetical protein
MCALCQVPVPVAPAPSGSPLVRIAPSPPTATHSVDVGHAMSVRCSRLDAPGMIGCGADHAIGGAALAEPGAPAQILTAAMNAASAMLLG